MAGSGAPAMRWAAFTALCNAFRSKVPVPDCDAVGQDALDCAAVEVHQNVRGQAVLPHTPQEEEALVSLLDQLGAAGRPGEILGDVDSQEPEAVHTFHRRPLDVDGWMWVSVPPEVHDELLGLLGVEQQVVGVAPLSRDRLPPPCRRPRRCLR